MNIDDNTRLAWTTVYRGDLNATLRLSAKKLQQPVYVFEKLLSSNAHLQERVISVATMPEWLVCLFQHHCNLLQENPELKPRRLMPAFRAPMLINSGPIVQQCLLTPAISHIFLELW